MSLFWLKLRMWLLVSIFFSILYGIIVGVGSFMRIGNFWFYLIASLAMMVIQYMIGPWLIGLMMRIKYVSQSEYPDLYRMVKDLSMRSQIPMPKIAVADMALPNAFAFGRWKSDGRVCVTRGIMGLLSENELKAVLAHEISHLKNRDVLTITLLSVIPLILYRIAFQLMWYGGDNRRREGGGNAVLIGMAAMVFYFITNLLVLYASRIREYFADRGAVALGSSPSNLASALYKLVYGSARADKESLRQVEGMKAFFANDPSCALSEIKELRQLDLDKSGTIDAAELAALSSKNLKLGFGERLLEVMSTHPNMLKRIKQLSSYKQGI